MAKQMRLQLTFDDGPLEREAPDREREGPSPERRYPNL
jgi:hypothetical protein